MSARARWWILGFAVAGLAFAGSSAWVHYKLVTEPSYVSPCDISATFNCTQVYLSRYGSVQGVPVALGGLIWFALVALLAWFARPGAADGDPTGAYVFALATVGLAAVIYLAYASFFVLKTGCLLCIGTYVSVVGIFVVSSASVSVPMTRLPVRLFSDLRTLVSRPTTLLVAILFLVGAASVVAFFPKEGSRPPAAAPPVSPGQDQEKAFAEAWAQQPRVDLGIPLAGAKVLVVKFLDWQCPSCKAAHIAYKPVLDKFAETHPGAVREVIKDFPLSSRCNFNVTVEKHPAACEAAAAVRMARDRGKADEMIGWLFSMPDQQGIRPAEVKKQVTTLLGLSAADFDKAYAARLPAIRRDVADGGALQVNSTPTYFVNGVRAQTPQGWLPAFYFELAIKLELDKAK